MKKCKIKYFSLLLILSVLLSFTGCGQEEDSQAESAIEIGNVDESETDIIQEEQVETVVEEEVVEDLSEENVVETKEKFDTPTIPSNEVMLSLANIPAYSGKPYVAINDNIPQFLDTDMSTTSYEYYSSLDSLGRCGVAYACIGKDIMPTEERGNIGSVKPTGWHTVKYDIVDGNYLYNRCHLIGFQLTGENANDKNLITGTRYMNVDGMLPFEDMVSDYVKETGNHVMYRVTPIFDGNNLLASGVLMEAKSVEDNGEGILFNVFCYNVQPGIIIDYASGASSAENVQVNVEPEPAPQPEPVPQPTPQPEPEAQPAPVPENNVQQNSIIANKNSGAFHRDSCSRLPKEKNRVYFNTREEALAAGFNSPCDYCNP